MADLFNLIVKGRKEKAAKRQQLAKQVENETVITFDTDDKIHMRTRKPAKRTRKEQQERQDGINVLRELIESL